jgi:hypothetical protein
MVTALFHYWTYPDFLLNPRPALKTNRWRY